MNIQQLYTGCLSEATYFISSNGEAAIIDPLRDIDPYLQLAETNGVTIKYVFETHFHADFVSGHLALSQKTGAPIVFGPGAKTQYPIHEAADGEVFSIGNLKLQALHTPGHTLESTSYVLFDESGNPHCIFTGDTLFVGDVGRPDLSSGNQSKEQLAAILYDTLQTKIKTLPDHLIVYPAHGPGSACGKKLGNETYSTIGEQKASNYALKDQTKEVFVEAITQGLTPPPDYFPINAKINQEGYDTVDVILEKSMRAISIDEMKQYLSEDTWILDTRAATVFTEGFIPGAVNIGLEGRFAEWAGALLPYDQPIVLVTEPGQEKESIIRLARVGFDKVVGYLDGGYAAWIQAGGTFDMIIDIEPDELAMDIPHDNKMEIIDVRKPDEYEAGHVKGAVNIPLDTFKDTLTLAQIDDDNNLYLHCAGGYRSVIAASLLKRQNFHNLRNVLGGFSKIKEVPEMPLVYPKTS